MNFTTPHPPIIDELRPIMREICRPLHGREYGTLDMERDAKLVETLFRQANLIRYMREGIDPTMWIVKADLAPLLKFV